MLCPSRFTPGRACDGEWRVWEDFPGRWVLGQDGQPAVFEGESEAFDARDLLDAAPIGWGPAVWPVRSVEQEVKS